MPYISIPINTRLIDSYWVVDEGCMGRKCFIPGKRKMPYHPILSSRPHQGSMKICLEHYDKTKFSEAESCPILAELKIIDLDLQEKRLNKKWRYEEF